MRELEFKERWGLDRLLASTGFAVKELYKFAFIYILKELNNSSINQRLPAPETSEEDPAVAANKTAKAMKGQTFPTNIVPGLMFSPKMLRTETFIAIMTWNTPTV